MCRRRRIQHMISRECRAACLPDHHEQCVSQAIFLSMACCVLALLSPSFCGLVASVVGSLASEGSRDLVGGLGGSGTSDKGGRHTCHGSRGSKEVTAGEAVRRAMRRWTDFMRRPGPGPAAKGCCSPGGRERYNGRQPASRGNMRAFPDHGWNVTNTTADEVLVLHMTRGYCEAGEWRSFASRREDG